ncbi:MAG: hypothetical protein ABI658_12840 [Acidimicrobiales bacterium]
MLGKNRRAKFAAFGALVTLGFIIFQGVGDAHNPEIAAKAECIVPTDQALITIDVHSWNTDLGDDHRTNDVVLTVTASGYNQTFNNAFNQGNNFAFTQKIQVPADGKTYTATATTDDSWGPNNDIIIPIGPQSRSVEVTVPQPCLPTTTTTAPTTTVAPTTAPSTTVAPTTAAPTTIPVSVQGIVETAPTTAPPATVGTAVQGVVLARTGTNAMPLVIGGVVLVLLGTAVELSARRRRSA